MTDFSNDNKKDEIKSVFGYPHSEQFPQSDQNFSLSYSNSAYHYPPSYDQYPYQYPPPFYYYPNCQSNYYNDDNNSNSSSNNNNDNILQPQLSNVAPPPRRKMVTFCRVFFCLIVVLILSVVIIFLIRFWNNYAYYPTFEVVSFVVHTFNITNSTNKLTAHWEVDVSVGNSNRKVEISFEYIATSLVYKFALLESSFSAPFNVAGKSNAEFHVDFDIPNSNQRHIGGIVVNEMARDRRNGCNLVVDLRIEAIIVNKYSNGNQYKRKLDVLCEDLVLKFKNSSSLPVWEGNTENYIRECFYDEYWWDFILQPW